MSSQQNYSLKEDFEILHGRIDSTDNDNFILSDELKNKAEQFKNYIRMSQKGGVYTVFGYRGTGKSSLVSHVINSIRKEEKKIIVLPVWLNLSTPTSSDNLLHQIIRGFYFEILKNKDLEITAVSALIEKAYTRTTFRMSFSNNMSHALEAEESEQTKASLDGAIGARVLGWLKAGIKAGVEKTTGGKNSQKNEESLATKFEYLDYDNRAAERDLFEFSSLGKEAKSLEIYPIVILDELDKWEKPKKAENGDVGQEHPFRKILKELKSLFASSGLHFIIIAGIDFYEEILEEESAEDSIFSSIITKNIYLPRDWGIGNKIVDHYFAEGENNKNKTAINQFKNYLNYRSKGVFNLAANEFYQFVRRDTDKKKSVVIEKEHLKRIKLYSRLQKIVDKVRKDIFSNRIVTNSLMKERITHTIYQIIDTLIQILCSTGKVEKKEFKEEITSDIKIEGINTADLVDEVLSGLAKENLIAKPDGMIQFYNTKVAKSTKESIKNEERFLSKKQHDFLQKIKERSKEEDQKDKNYQDSYAELEGKLDDILKGGEIDREALKDSPEYTELMLKYEDEEMEKNDNSLLIIFAKAFAAYDNLSELKRISAYAKEKNIDEDKFNDLLKLFNPEGNNNE